MKLKNGQKLLNWGKAQPKTSRIRPKDAVNANPTKDLIADTIFELFIFRSTKTLSSLITFAIALH